MSYLPIPIDQNNVIGNQGGSFPGDWFTYLNSLGAIGTLGDSPSWMLLGYAYVIVPANWPVRVRGAQQFGPWKRGNTFYYALMGIWNPPTQPLAPPNNEPQGTWGVQPYKSTDGGVTWQTMNPIWGPENSANFTVAYDKLNGRILVGVLNRPLNVGFILGEYFDLATEEWVNSFAPLGPSAFEDTGGSRIIFPDGITSLWLRPDGTLLMLSGAGYQAGDLPGYQAPFDGGTRFQAQAWPDPADAPLNRYWLRPFFFDANFPNVGGVEGMASAVKAVLDPVTGTLHTVFCFVGASSYFAYQQILLNNTLGPSALLSLMPAPAANPRIQFGNPFLWNGKILVPMRDGTAPGFFFLVADLSAPTVWKKVGPIDPDRNSDVNLYATPQGGSGSFCFDGQVLYYVNIVPSFDGSKPTARLRVCWSQDGVNWAAYTAWDITGSVYDFPTQNMSDLDTFPGSLGITLSLFAPGAPVVQRFVFVAGGGGGGAGGGPGGFLGPAVLGGSVVVKGVKRVKKCLDTPNLTPAPVSKPVKMAF